MPETNFVPVRFPAYALKIRYQHNLMLGYICACLMMLTPAIYLHLFQDIPVVIDLPQGHAIDTTRTGPSRPIDIKVTLPRPQGVMGPEHHNQFDKSGFIPIIGPDLDEFFEDSGYLGYFGGADSLPLPEGEYAIGGTGTAAPYTSDSAIYSFNAPIERLPELLWMKDPEYPEFAGRAGTEGKVILHILVNEQGRAEQVIIFSESPERFGFGRKAFSAAREAYFLPALNNHFPVKCWVRLPVEFEID